MTEESGMNVNDIKYNIQEQDRPWNNIYLAIILYLTSSNMENIKILTLLGDKLIKPGGGGTVSTPEALQGKTIGILSFTSARIGAFIVAVSRHSWLRITKRWK